MTTFGGRLVISFAVFVLCEGNLEREPPHFFVNANQSIVVYKDSTAILPCAVDYLGPRTVAWRRISDDYVLSIGTMMYAQQKQMSINYFKQYKWRTHWNLVIKRAQPSHSGIYECQISTEIPLTHLVFLRVLNATETAKPSVFLNGTVYVSRYQNVELTCIATGSTRAPADIDWFYEGTKINTNSKKWRGRVVITKYQPEIPGHTLISCLNISNSTHDDRGTYICRSTDLATKSMEVFILNADREVNKREKDIDFLTFTDIIGSYNSASVLQQTMPCNMICLFMCVLLM